MNKFTLIGLGSLLIATSAFANYTDMNCKVVGKNLVVQGHFNYEEGYGREEGTDYPKEKAKKAFFNHLVDSVTLLDSKGNKLADFTTKQKNYGFFLFETNDGTFIPPVLKVDFKNEQGTVIVIRAKGHSAQKDDPHGNGFQVVKGKLVLVARGSDREKLSKNFSDLRDAKVECQADTD